MLGLSFTILGETPCADPHAGCCRGRGLELESPRLPDYFFMQHEPLYKALHVLILDVAWFAINREHTVIGANDLLMVF